MESRLLWGTVEMLILEVLSRGDSYGYQITQMVTSESDGYFQLKEGSLYPALHRMNRGKLLKSYWVDQPEGRRRKYYKLTAKGQRTLETKREDWQRFSSAVSGVLGNNRALA
jgi:PadR family transcriptional regulator PadR